MPDAKENNNEKQIIIGEKNFEIFITKLIPTSQYFERSFQTLQIQIDDLKEGQKDLKLELERRSDSLLEGQRNLKKDLEKQIESVRDGQKELKADMDKRFEQVDKRFEQVDKRFEQVDKRFEQIDKRFEQVDKRFEQVDKRFEQINEKLDKILERVDVKIDAGLRENRAISIRLFTFAMLFSAISMAGFLAKMMGLF